MSLFLKDTRNSKNKKTSSYNFSTEKELIKRANRLKQRADSAQENLTDIQDMQEIYDMHYFDIVRRQDYNKILEVTEGKINKIHQRMANRTQSPKGAKVAKCNSQQNRKNHLDGELKTLLPESVY